VWPFGLTPVHQNENCCLRPTGENDDVQVLWWRGTGWATPGDFGPLIMPLNEALNFVATESFFWIGA
jgi:hypothetical protein